MQRLYYDVMDVIVAITGSVAVEVVSAKVVLIGVDWSVNGGNTLICGSEGEEELCL